MTGISIRKERVVDLTASLVGINSVNPSLSSGGPGEAAMAAFVAEVLRGMGLEAQIEEAAPGRPNVLARLVGQGSGPALLLNGHLDTVSIEGMSIPPLAPEQRDGRLFGRGAADMKGGLACLLAALEAVIASRRTLRGDVVFAATADEEYASVGMERLLGQVSAAAGIIAEPTDLAVVIAHKGFSWIEIETLGRAAHGSDAVNGIDAIGAMGAVLTELAALDGTYAAIRHPLLGTPTIHASLIEGGRELSTYPDRCRLQVERRNLPSETRADVEAEIHALLARAALRDQWLRANAKVFFHRDGAELPKDSPIIEVLRGCFANVTGRQTELAGLAGWPEAGLLTAAGIPTVLFGPSGSGLHGACESVDVESLHTCATVLAETIVAFCGA